MTDRGQAWMRWAVSIYWVTLTVATHWPRLVIEVPAGMPIDKLLHAGAFGLLAGLLRGAMSPRRWRTAALASIVYLPIDEYTQIWFGRTFDYGDMIAGLVGVLLVSAMLKPAQPAESGTADDHRAPCETSGGFVHHATLVAALTFASRLTGLVRDTFVAALLGTTIANEAFQIGFQIPNLFRRLFGEGALTAAFIPHYTQLAQTDAQLGRRFVTQCLLGLLAVTGVITLAGEAALGAWLMWGDPTGKVRLGLLMTMAMLPYMPLICATALASGALQVHGRFAAPAAAPVLLNVAMIGFAGWGWRIYGDGDDTGIAWMLAAGVGAAGAAQLLWQLGEVGRQVGFDLGRGGTGAAMRGMIAMMLPMLVGLSVFQINTFLDSLIAFGLSHEDPSARLQGLGLAVAYPVEAGAVVALTYGQRLYQFPLGVFSIAIATAIFPALARQARPDSLDDFGRTLRQGLRLSMFIGLPASAGLMILRQPMTQLFFEHGDFSHDDARLTARMLGGYAAGIWAYSLTHVLTRAFHARTDAKTPLRISLAMVALNFALNVVLIWPLGAAGLAISTAISGSCQTLLLIAALRRAGVGAFDGAVLRSWLRSAGLTLVMIPPLWLLVEWARPHGWAASGWVTAAGVGIGAMVVLGGSWVSGSPEARWFVRRRVGE